MSIRHKFWFMGINTSHFRLLLKSGGLCQMVIVFRNVQ